MPRWFCTFRVRRTGIAAAVATGVALAGLPHLGEAAGTKQLQHVRGTIGYQTAEAGTDFKPVFGKFDLPDDNFAATHAQSAAVLAMPDSSLVSLGENTTVKVGAFDTSAAGPGSTITVNGGALRFDIRRPAGGVANYRFVTATSAVGVRGTVGLISFVNGVTTVGCLACAADSVTVTAGGQTVTLLTGQFITVSATGAITTGTLSTVVGSFSSAGVPVSAQASAAAAGVPSAGVLGVSTGTATAIGAAAVVTGTSIGIATSQGSPSPKPTTSSNGSNGSNGGSAGQPGNLNLNSVLRAPQAAVTPSPQPSARAIPPPLTPFGPGRVAR